MYNAHQVCGGGGGVVQKSFFFSFIDCTIPGR